MWEFVQVKRFVLLCFVFSFNSRWTSQNRWLIKFSARTFLSQILKWHKKTRKFVFVSFYFLVNYVTFVRKMHLWQRSTLIWNRCFEVLTSSFFDHCRHWNRLESLYGRSGGSHQWNLWLHPAERRHRPFSVSLTGTGMARHLQLYWMNLCCEIAGTQPDLSTSSLLCTTLPTMGRTSAWASIFLQFFTSSHCCLSSEYTTEQKRFVFFEAEMVSRSAKA